MWLYFSILFFPYLIHAEPLRVVVPFLNQSVSKLYDEGGNISFLNLPKEPFKIQPVFGDQRQSDVFYEDIPLNDPSGPLGQVHGKFFPEMDANVNNNGDIHLTLQRASSVSVHGLVDQKWDIFLDYPFNPVLSVASISFNEEEKLKKAFFSSKDTFSINDSLNFSYSFFYNEGQSSYLGHFGINEENLRQHGGKVNLSSQNNIFWKTGYSAFHRSYPGPFNVTGTRFFSELGGLVIPKLSLNLRMDFECKDDLRRMIGSLGLKNSNFGGLLRFYNEGLYPKIYAQLSFSPLYQQKLKFMFLGDYKPPMLTEVYTDFFYHDTFLRQKSEISGDGLISGKMYYEIPFNIYKSFFDLKVEYFYNPIGWNYEKLFYENRESFVRPSFSMGISFRDYKTFWEGSFQKYIYASSANTFQFLEFPKKIFRLKFENVYNEWGFQIQNILYLDIDRYKENVLFPLPGYAFDFSFEINRRLESFPLKPFFQLIVTKRDPNAIVRDASLWWIGIKF